MRPTFTHTPMDDCRNLHPKTLAEGAEVQVGFTGEFGAARVSPRELLSSYVGHLVCIEGIVTKASTVRPKWVRSVHYCPANGKTTTREYRCGHSDFFWRSADRQTPSCRAAGKAPNLLVYDRS